MSNPSIFVVLSCSIVVAGCAAQTAPLRMDAGHPADPRVPEAPMARFIRLEPDAFDRALTPEPVGNYADSTTLSPVEGHAMPSKHQHGRGPGGSDAGAPASADSSATRRRAADSEMFVCPMHREVTDVKASKCPKCGMALIRRKEKR